MAQPEPTPEVSLRSLVESVAKPGMTANEIAQCAYAEASADEKDVAAIEGLRTVALTVTREWNKPIRSGHKNKSGRLRLLPTMPGGILSETVRLNDGSAFIVGDVTLDIAAELMAQYKLRVETSLAGAKFWQDVHKQMRTMQATCLADLGEERVEALRKKWNYRA